MNLAEMDFLSSTWIGGGWKIVLVTAFGQIELILQELGKFLHRGI
jgi:hypothetical protein